MLEQQIKHNNAVGAYRYLFSLVIFLLHFRPNSIFGEENRAFYGGYLSVEFFFILAGFFLMVSYYHDKKTCSCNDTSYIRVRRFFKRRLLRLYPQYLLSFFCVAFMLIIYHKLTIKKFLIYGIWEATTLNVFGFPNIPINTIGWFVGPLIVTSSIIYFLLCENEDLYLHFIAPSAFIIIMALFYRNLGHVDLTNSYHFLVSDGFWRAFAEIGLGCLCYKVYEYLLPYVQGRFSLSFTLLEIAMLFISLYVMYRTRRDVKDFVSTPGFF